MSSAGATALTFPRPAGPSRVNLPDMLLRHATAMDAPFLVELHRSFRMEGLAAVQWPQDQKHAFLDQQFAFQHRHFTTTFPNADFLIIEREKMPIGRLYLDFAPRQWHIIDIGLLAAWRGRGNGSALLSAVQRQAAKSGAGVILHVEQHNVRAHRLYRRQSFRDIDSSATHIRMEWDNRDDAAITPQ